MTKSYTGKDTMSETGRRHDIYEATLYDIERAIRVMKHDDALMGYIYRCLQKAILEAYRPRPELDTEPAEAGRGDGQKHGRHHGLQGPDEPPG